MVLIISNQVLNGFDNKGYPTSQIMQFFNNVQKEGGGKAMFIKHAEFVKAYGNGINS